jgi:hypothetical protein
MGEWKRRVPDDQFAGSVVRLLWALSRERPPDATSRKLTDPAPVGLRMAIQYLVPDVTAAPGTVTAFQAPLTGAAIVPWVRRVPGLLLGVLVYSPTTTLLAALDASRYTLSRVTVPLAAAVYWKAWATPAPFESICGSTV